MFDFNWTQSRDYSEPERTEFKFAHQILVWALNTKFNRNTYLFRANSFLDETREPRDRPPHCAFIFCKENIKITPLEPSLRLLELFIVRIIYLTQGGPGGSSAHARLSTTVQNNIYPLYTQYDQCVRVTTHTAGQNVILLANTCFAVPSHKPSRNEQGQNHCNGVQKPSKMTRTNRFSCRNACLLELSSFPSRRCDIARYIV
jgi:hypothetical protein